MKRVTIRTIYTPWVTDPKGHDADPPEAMLDLPDTDRVLNARVIYGGMFAEMARYAVTIVSEGDGDA